MNLTYYNMTIVLIMVLVVFSAWLWRYQIKPFYKKKELYKLLKKHPAAKTLIEKEQFLATVYADINTHRISESERARLNISEDAFIYGEIEYLPFFMVLDSLNPKKNEVFYDLGSGAGKAVLTAACFFELKKACGIELLPGLYDIANAQTQKAVRLSLLHKKPNLTRQLDAIHWIQGDILNVDLSEADIVFINATCLSYFTWEKLIEKCARLKKGSRVIVTTKKITSPHFDLLYEEMTLMSWGTNSINAYIKN